MSRCRQNATFLGKKNSKKFKRGENRNNHPHFCGPTFIEIPYLLPKYYCERRMNMGM